MQYEEKRGIKLFLLYLIPSLHVVLRTNIAKSITRKEKILEKGKWICYYYYLPLM